MAIKSILSAKHLREILHYDPDTGLFTWRVYHGGRSKAGKPAGSTQWMRPGYSRRRIIIGRREYKANCLAWLYMTGEWPDRKVDHINTDPMDNRWVNLRLATSAQNQWNVGMRRNNTTGFTGVYYDKRRNKYRTELHVHLGRFDTAEEAYEVYRRAIIKLRGTEFLHSSLRMPS